MTEEQLQEFGALRAFRASHPGEHDLLRSETRTTQRWLIGLTITLGTLIGGLALYGFKIPLPGVPQ